MKTKEVKEKEAVKTALRSEKTIARLMATASKKGRVHRFP
jgi:hypothetical protein